MELPARIGKYELQEFLGGGMSHVYRARDTLIGRTVAVKILTEAGCQDAEVKARFLAEARMAGNLTHDNVLGIYDFGEDDQHRPFMVMEFLRGEDLRHAIRNGHTGDLRNKFKIALQVARALEYVHTQKIIHRDIKPENIHINAAGVVKLMDFGIAKTEGLAMTRAGYVLGTPYYMAPEQVTGEKITEQVDVYAFGVLLFEMLTGRKPIDRRCRGADLLQHSERAAEAGAAARVRGAAVGVRPDRAMHGEESGGAAAGLRRGVCGTGGFARGLGCAHRGAAFDARAGITAAVCSRASKPRWIIPAILALIAVGAGVYFATRPKAPVPLAKTLDSKGGSMVLVDAGEFLVGEEKRRDSLPAFYIDRTEVSNREYAQFCAETKHALPRDFAAGRLDLPVVNVLISDARAFAAWAGKRLPKSREWEKAARGKDGFLYPWGNAAEPARANVGSGTLLPVDAARRRESLRRAEHVGERVGDGGSASPPGPRAMTQFTDLFKAYGLRASDHDRDLVHCPRPKLRACGDFGRARLVRLFHHAGTRLG